MWNQLWPDTWLVIRIALNILSSLSLCPVVLEEDRKERTVSGKWFQLSVSQSVRDKSANLCMHHWRKKKEREKKERKSWRNKRERVLSPFLLSLVLLHFLPPPFFLSLWGWKKGNQIYKLSSFLIPVNLLLLPLLISHIIPLGRD